MTSVAAVLAGIGGYLPPRIVTNDELSASLDTSDEWIRTRTGIHQRHWADAGVATSDLAVEAGHRALKSAGLLPGAAVEMVVLATTTPDHPCPGTAPNVASRLGLRAAAAFDVSAVCSGFVYGLAVGAAAISAGQAELVMVIGAETYSTILNPADRATSVIFGDGAGAVLLRRGDPGEQGALLAFDLGSDGALKDLIAIPAGGSRQRSTSQPAAAGDHYFTMQGREVFAHAVTRMAESSTAVLHAVGWPADTVDHLVGHQANLRILHTLAETVGIDPARAAVNLDQVGNTSAASIPLALVDAAPRLHPGERLLLTAFGGGLTWGAAALTWPDITPV